MPAGADELPDKDLKASCSCQVLLPDDPGMDSQG